MEFDPPAAVDLEVVRFGRLGFAGVTGTLALVGGVVAAYGTILVGVAHRFDLSVATAGLALSANFAGALLGVVACWWALRRVAGGRALAVALVVFAAGLAAAALASTWPVFLVAVGVVGVGFGALDAGILALLSRTEVRQRPWRLSVTGSAWAIGSIAGPLLIVLLHPDRFGVFLGIASLIALAFTALVTDVRAPPARPPRTARAVPWPRNRRAVVQTFVVGFCAYVALETAVSGWVATQLHGWGVAVAVGSLVTAGFWAGLAMGRLAARRLLARWHGHGIVLVGLACAVGLLLAASVRWLAPIAYPLAGVALASVFPLGLHWFTELSPGDHDGVASLVLVGMVGGILGTGAENLAVAAFGTRVVSFVATALAVCCLLVFASATRFRAPAPSEVSGARD